MQMITNPFRELVVSKIAAAYCKRIGVMKYEIRRPKLKTENFIAGYAILSDLCDTPEWAWRNAWKKLGGADH